MGDHSYNTRTAGRAIVARPAIDDRLGNTCADVQRFSTFRAIRIILALHDMLDTHGGVALPARMSRVGAAMEACPCPVIGVAVVVNFYH